MSDGNRPLALHPAIENRQSKIVLPLRFIRHSSFDINP
jgi:hypothetical protein